MNEQNEVKPKKKGRGPGKKPALVCTSIRLNREVMEFFNKHHAHNKQAKMRDILIEYVKNETKLKEPQHGTQETVDE